MTIQSVTENPRSYQAEAIPADSGDCSVVGLMHSTELRAPGLLQTGF